MNELRLQTIKKTCEKEMEILLEETQKNTTASQEVFLEFEANLETINELSTPGGLDTSTGEWKGSLEAEKAELERS